MNQLSVMGKVSSTAGLRLTVGGGGTPGVYVPATPDTCNVGVLLYGECFFYSDQFGGCDFTVLRDAAGNIYGSHVHSSAACRADIAAVPPGWSVLYTWRSGPYARLFGMTGSNSMLCFVTGNQLRFLYIRLQGTPNLVHDIREAASMRI